MSFRPFYIFLLIVKTLISIHFREGSFWFCKSSVPAFYLFVLWVWVKNFTSSFILWGMKHACTFCFTIIGPICVLFKRLLVVNNVDLLVLKKTNRKKKPMDFACSDVHAEKFLNWWCICWWGVMLLRAVMLVVYNFTVYTLKVFCFLLATDTN